MNTKFHIFQLTRQIVNQTFLNFGKKASTENISKDWITFYLPKKIEFKVSKSIELKINFFGYFLNLDLVIPVSVEIPAPLVGTMFFS